MEAHLARIEERNPALNAVVTLDAERALRRAREADEALARGQVWGPLHGVPYTLKDGHQTAGMRTTAGFPPLAHYVPDQDGTVAARLKAAGGVLMGKTNVPTMLTGFHTDNAIFGRSNNPWDLERTPGGSSGGAAAALAAGLTPIEVGSDLGGSIRIPAHFCGLFGLKPTERRVSLVGHIPGLPGSARTMRNMASIGPLARDLGDIELLFGLLAGPDGRDHEVPPVPVEPASEVDLAGVRIAVSAGFPNYVVSEAVSEALRSLARTLEPHAQVVEMPELPATDLAWSSASNPLHNILAASQGTDEGDPVALRTQLEAWDRRDRFISAWEAFFDAWDVLICPVAATTATRHSAVGAPVPVDGREVDYWDVNAHCFLFTYTGHPVVTMPYALDDGGLPLGYQLVGRRWSESGLLGIAKALESVTGSFRRPPGA
ncbi:MAG: amidase [Deinococcales bacterium]